MNKFIKVLSKPCFIILFLFSLGCDQASEKKSENDNLQNSFIIIVPMKNFFC